MKSKSRGKSTSAIEVTHIDSHGFWLYVNDSEYFLSYDEYPWFKQAKVKEILNVRLSHGCHLYWPDLDIDLELDCITNPQSYPLKYK
ncbi:MAG: DUF2442 domain-containing protein [Sedimentisphaerales bacterium]|nr:DUF2442 domain-containing protein [Sedimentisphaerales bacterium]